MYVAWHGREGLHRVAWVFLLCFLRALSCESLRVSAAGDELDTPAIMGEHRAHGTDDRNVYRVYVPCLCVTLRIASVVVAPGHVKMRHSTTH